MTLAADHPVATVGVSRRSTAARPATWPPGSSCSSTPAWAKLHLNLGAATVTPDQPAGLQRRRAGRGGRRLPGPAARGAPHDLDPGRPARPGPGRRTASATPRSSTRSAGSTSRRATSTCSCSASGRSPCSARSARPITSTSWSRPSPAGRGQPTAAPSPASIDTLLGHRPAVAARLHLPQHRAGQRGRRRDPGDAGRSRPVTTRTRSRARSSTRMHATVDSLRLGRERPLLGRDADRPHRARGDRRAKPSSAPQSAGVRRHQFRWRRVFGQSVELAVGENLVLAPDEIAQFSIDSGLIDFR